MSGAGEDGEVIAAPSTVSSGAAGESGEVSGAALPDEDVLADTSRSPGEASDELAGAHTVVDTAAEPGAGASKGEDVFRDTSLLVSEAVELAGPNDDPSAAEDTAAAPAGELDRSHSLVTSVPTNEDEDSREGASASGAGDAAEVFAAIRAEVEDRGDDEASPSDMASGAGDAAQVLAAIHPEVEGARAGDEPAMLVAGGVDPESASPPAMAGDEAEGTELASSAEVRALEDSATTDGIEATESEAAEDVLRDSSSAGRAGATASTVEAGDEAEEVLGAGSAGDEAAAAESKLAVEEEDVLEASSEGGGFRAMESPAAAEVEAAEEVVEDSSTAQGLEAAVPDEVAEDVLGDSLAPSTAAGGEHAAEDVLGEEPAAAEVEVESAGSIEAVAAAEDVTAGGEDAVEPAASDADPSSTEDGASKPVRSDSDEDEAGGLFLNTGEGLGARELGDVDEDEDDAQ
ncbi:hypothetical protein [Nannocystis pusilla]|uniref:hypothetical protein n=1 Tax=Nannocystis pusilla TaxID=889268 RepID=UPI003DA4A68D